MMFGKIVPVVSCQISVLVSGYDTQMFYVQKMDDFSAKQRNSGGYGSIVGSFNFESKKKKPIWDMRCVEDYVRRLRYPLEVQNAVIAEIGSKSRTPEFVKMTYSWDYLDVVSKYIDERMEELYKVYRVEEKKKQQKEAMLKATELKQQQYRENQKRLKLYNENNVSKRTTMQRKWHWVKKHILKK